MIWIRLCEKCIAMATVSYLFISPSDLWDVLDLLTGDTLIAERKVKATTSVVLLEATFLPKEREVIEDELFV